MRKRTALFVVLVLAVTAYSQPKRRQSKVVDCGQVTQTRPGRGHGFRGEVVNEDYVFSARIRGGLTGWGGVAQVAPFHGFTIFLDSQMKSCIIFEVHLRVDDNPPRHPRTATPIQLGRAQGWQWAREGNIADSTVANFNTSFSFGPPNHVDDGEVLLIAPTPGFQEAKAAYDEFVRSIKFGQ
jgi:hypothetical protein